MGAAGQATGYEIDQSIRFNDDDSAYLTKTFSSAGDRQKWTWSAWLKLSGSTARQIIFGATGTPSYISINENAAGSAFFNLYNAGWYWETAAKYRDPSGWYHLVWAFDTTDATADNRMRFYINGSEVTDYSTKHQTGSENASGDINNNVAHFIGKHPAQSSKYYDGYLAEINFIDGTALGPTSFGKTNNDGVWIPEEYSGAYGSNGFFIDGRDSSDLGDDESGNGNDFTSSGLAAADQMSDTPTKNFCTMNPLDAPTGSITLSNGNLDLNQSSFNKVRGTIAFDVQDDDGFYFEVKKTNGNYRAAGIVATDASNFASAQSLLSVNPSVAYYMEGGEVYQNGSDILASLPTFATNDVLGVAVRNGKVYFAKNNTWVNSGDPVNETGQVASITGSSPLYSPAVGEQNNQSGITNTVNFGATAFAHTPPTGYKALNTANLDTSTIKDGSAYFQATTYTGDGGSSHAIDQTGNSTFEPSLVWIKSRSATTNNVLQDQVRGNFVIYSDLANPQGATGGGWVKSFDSDGFTTDVNTPINASGETFVGWQWKANGSGSSNTDGSITSSVSADTTSGFSIATYTGTGSNATVGHGLGAVPKMIIIKDTTNTESWIVYNEAVGNDGNLYLNLTNGKATQAIFQDTTPTSSVFSLGTIDGANKASAGHVAYCFAEVEGYSSISGYTGNGSTDGPFVYTGFKPAFIMTKRTNAAGDWKMWDNERGPYNVNGVTLAANTGGTESTGTAQESDFLSNGFKIRGNDTETNGSGSTYIYMAFAENPFGGDGVAPVTAR